MDIGKSLLHACVMRSAAPAPTSTSSKGAGGQQAGQAVMRGHQHDVSYGRGSSAPFVAVLAQAAEVAGCLLTPSQLQHRLLHEERDTTHAGNLAPTYERCKAAKKTLLKQQWCIAGGAGSEADAVLKVKALQAEREKDVRSKGSHPVTAAEVRPTVCASVCVRYYSPLSCLPSEFPACYVVNVWQT